jgi:hypothetical protein
MKTVQLAQSAGLLQSLAIHIPFDRVYPRVAYLVIPGLNGWATAAFLDRGTRFVPLVKFSSGPEPTATITAPAYLEWGRFYGKKPVPANEFLSEDAMEVAEVADALRVISATRAFMIGRIGGLLPSAKGAVARLPMRVDSLDVA